MAGNIGVGSADDLAAENRRLRAELEALKRVAGTLGGESPQRVVARFHDDECLRSSEFSTPRGKAAKDAINDDVTHEFFSAHERNTALNVQRDIRQSCRIADDRRRKLLDARQILDRANAHVDESSTSTQDELEKQFEGFRSELGRREGQFRDDLERHRRGEVLKIQREQAIVKRLLVTLESLVAEAMDVMAGPKDVDLAPDDVRDYKTLAEIKDEFTELRQILLPWDIGYLFDKITAKASEQMIDIRTTAVHDIIAGLIETLNSARDKADATYHTLEQFTREVERVVPETVQRVQSEFARFQDLLTEKQRMFAEKVHHYRQNYTQRIQTEVEFVEEWLEKLGQAQQDAREAVGSGNDYQLLSRLEVLNNDLVQIDGSTLTLGYDRISFSPCSSILHTAMDQLGVLQREEIECNPLFGNCFHYYHFLEHKEYMYGGSDESEHRPSATIGQRERDMFENAFRRIDTNNSGTLDETELEVLWGEVFKTVPKESVRAITTRIFREIDSNNNGNIQFSEFIEYITEGMKTNLGAQRDYFYRSDQTQSGLAASIGAASSAKRSA